MNQKLTDLTQAALVRANRANLYEFFCYFKNSSYMEFTETEGISRWSCTFQYAWFNAILCARDATSADGAYLDESLAYFKARNTSEISLWLEDDESFAGWEALITPCGFKLAEGPYGISMDLNRLNETGQMPAETELKIVNDEKSLQDCAEAIVYGYGYPPDRKDNTVDFLLCLGLDGPYRSYVAYWEGKPVSTAAVFLGQEVAGIYTVATLPEAQGKGFGAAGTLAPCSRRGIWVTAWESFKLPKWFFPFIATGL